MVFIRGGPELPSEKAENQGIGKGGGAESGALGSDSANNRQPADLDLADVVKAWPNLSAAKRRTILAIAKGMRYTRSIGTAR